MVQPSSKQSFPLVSKELAEELNRRFPERCPDPLLTDREVWLAVGERQAIRFILKKYNDQTQSSLGQ